MLDVLTKTEEQICIIAIGVQFQLPQKYTQAVCGVLRETRRRSEGVKIDAHPPLSPTLNSEACWESVLGRREGQVLKPRRETGRFEPTDLKFPKKFFNKA